MSTSPKPNGQWCSRHRPQHPPSNRNVAWYQRERPKWIAFLGGKCSWPGCDATTELEFHHDEPRNWEPRKTSRWQRLRNYIRDIKAGKVRRLLCRVHNAMAGYPDGQLALLEEKERQRVTSEGEPF